LRFIIHSCLILLFLSCQSKRNSGCADLRKGYYVIDKPLYGYVLTAYRTDSTQVETSNRDDTVSTYRIHWVNDCEYTLRRLSYYIKSGTSGKRISPEVPVENAPIVTFTVTDVTPDYYTFVGREKNVKFVLRDTMWRKKVGGFRPIGDVFR
jgi:hypothetical protein